MFYAIYILVLHPNNYELVRINRRAATRPTADVCCSAAYTRARRADAAQAHRTLELSTTGPDLHNIPT